MVNPSFDGGWNLTSFDEPVRKAAKKSYLFFSGMTTKRRGRGKGLATKKK